MIVNFSLVTLLVATIALASPSSGLARRTCGLGPSYIDILNITAPIQPSSTYSQFTLTRDGNPVSNTQIVAMTFDLIPPPPRAADCRLPSPSSPNQIRSHGVPRPRPSSGPPTHGIPILPRRGTIYQPSRKWWPPLGFRHT